MIEIVSSIDKIEYEDLFICPTVYCTSFAQGDLENNTYLRVLASEIDPRVSILWTGDEVVSETIPQKGLKDIRGLFSNPLIIWDNFYANDYCPSRFYIGPYKGRKSIYKFASAVGINPTGLPITDMICLSRFMSDLTDRQILDEYKIPKEFSKILPYFTNPFRELPSLNLSKIDKLIQTQYKLCIEWKGDLQLEWACLLYTSPSPRD